MRQAAEDKRENVGAEGGRREKQTTDYLINI